MLARLSLFAALLGTPLLTAIPADSPGVCGGGLPAPDDPGAVNTPEADRMVGPQHIAQISEGQTAFALDLYRTLREHESGNLFFSPMSVSTALSMTAAGARGQTADEMAAVLRLKDPVVKLEDGSLHPNEDLHAAIGALLHKLTEHGTTDGDKKGEAEKKTTGPRLDIANALWGQRGYPFLDSFITFLDEHYGASLTELDFMDGEGAAALINEWVESKTNERIKDLVDASIVEGAALVLTNAIYFKGDWKEAFDSDRTHDDDFHVDPETTVTVPMMRQMGRFEYVETDHFQALRMLYTGESMSMVVLLPREERSLEDIEHKLTTENLREWFSEWRTERVNLILPRFTMTEEFSLNEVLGAMGMPGAFSPGANFSGIDQSGQLYISDVVHKAFVEVNEEGTEAAAATGVVMPTSAQPDPIKLFRVDRPFMFMIHDAATDSILFMGRVMNPAG